MCKKRTNGGLEYRQCIAEQKELTESSLKPRIRKSKAIGAKQWDRPNILLITTDQQRRDTLGCYGDDIGVNVPLSSRKFMSPNIDKLAKEGMRFTQAFSASPSCTPSRMSILLGVHVPIHTVLENGLNNYHQKFIPFIDILKVSYIYIYAYCFIFDVGYSSDFLL